MNPRILYVDMSEIVMEYNFIGNLRGITINGVKVLAEAINKNKNLKAFGLSIILLYIYIENSNLCERTENRCWVIPCRIQYCSVQQMKRASPNNGNGIFEY